MCTNYGRLGLSTGAGSRVQNVDLDRWYNIVFVRDKQQENLYFYSDSNLIGTIDSTGIVIGNYNQPIMVGGGYSLGCGPSTFFNGTIDEVMIYNRALTEDEIKAIYEVQGKV